MSGFSFERLEEKYHIWQESMNYSARTIEDRGYLLRYFFRWCDDRGLCSPREITPAILENYRVYVSRFKKSNGDNLAISSQSSRLGAVKSFFKFMFKNSYVIYDPAVNLEFPRSEFRIPTAIMTPEEVEQVLDSIGFGSDLEIRDRGIFEVLYSTGMRRSELCNLELRDVSFKKGILIIRQGKGKKDRVIPIGDRALLWVEKYVDDVRLHHVMNPEEKILFVTQYGRPIRPKHLTRIGREYLKKSGVNKGGACHIFRHSMATAMLENGTDIRYIQDMLGHASIEATQIYARVAITKLKEIHSQKHPASKLERKPDISDI